MAKDAERVCPIVRATPVQQRMESLEERSMHYSGCLLSNDESEPPHDRLSAQNLQALQATFRGISYFIEDEN